MQNYSIDYEAAKQIAQFGSYPERAQLAASPNTAPELLVFLAADSSDSVRQALAQNPALPVAGIKLLARDRIEAVRMTMAHEVGRLWGERHHNSPDAALAKEALSLLAIDEAVTVRTALASAIAEVAMVPQDIAEKLAMDAVEAVAVPILQHYAQFEDKFLIDLLSQRSDVWARHAIAQRKTLSMDLTGLLLSDDKDQILPQLLLGNAGAQFAAPMWESFSQKAEGWAKTSPALLQIFANRADLPFASAERLAGFVDDAIFTVLASRTDYDTATRRQIIDTARRRADWIDREKDGKLPPIIRVRELYDEDKLDDDAIRDALALHDPEFLKLALSIKSGILPDTIEKILASESPKAIVALSWRAGLSARTALALQKHVGGIPPHRLIHPKGGTDYAMTEPDMLWQLEFYGVKT